MDRYRVTPGSTVNLADHDPGDRSEFKGNKSAGKKRQAELAGQLADLQRLLWAEDKHKVLIVFQAMDTAGKDGTIRKLLARTNPQGVKVANFKKPTPKELSHDYLWRVHPHAPATGEIGVFNRSHYEDVLVVRVLDLVPEQRWSRRYEHIADFEQLLADEGTTIIKFYLHIDLDTQKERLQARLDDPEKRWKFNVGDLDHRGLWPEYMAAYEAAISKTSTEDAPWYVIPSNRKWYRNLMVTQIVVDTLRGLDMEWPEPEEGLDDVVID
ncbi:MAG: polyphosphate kinase 2 family protein [Acidimicrobiia bacterium]|nr:polyphosphate kinase 2 family protein [Acidimicrobiia bacterium]